MTTTSLRRSPNVDRLNLDGLPILASRTDHRRALVYWHGFPGPYDERANGGVRIADQVFDDVIKNHDFYYPLYTDLASGPFDFYESVAKSAGVLAFVRARKAYDSITVVGQSWGAVIALNAYDPRGIAKLILITPFLGIPTGDAARRVLTHYAATYSEVLPVDQSVYLAQIERIAREMNPARVLARPVGAMTIFAADADPIAPLRTIEALRPPTSRLIVLPDQTHEVEDRRSLRTAFIAELI